MSLQKQVVEVPIHAGTSDQVHEYVAVGPSNAEVKDARFQEDGSIAKRFGTELLPDLAGKSAALSGEGGAHTILESGGRVAALTHDGPFAHDEVYNTWSPLGRIGPRPSQVRTDPLVRGNNSLRHADMAVATISGKTIALCVWHDLEEDKVYYAWWELPSDGRPAVPLRPPVEVTGGLTRFPKCAVAGNRFAIVGTNSTQSAVFGTSVVVTSSYTMPSATSIHTFANQVSTTTLEFFADGTGASAAYWIVNGHNSLTYVYRRKDDFTASANATISKAGPVGAGLANGHVVIAHRDGTVSRIIQDLSAAGTTAGPFLTPSATTAVHVATVVQADSTGRFLVAWSGDGCSVPDAGGIGNFGLDVVFFSNTWAGISQTTLGGVRLGGRACWDNSTASPLFPLINRQSNFAGSDLASPSLTQFFSGYVGRPVYTDAAGSAFLRLAPVCSYGIDTADLYQANFGTTQPSSGIFRNHLPSMRAVSAGRFVMPFVVYTQASIPIYKRHVDLLRLDTVGSPSLRTVSAQGVRLSSGGIVNVVDGVVGTELTPPPPVYVDASTVDTAYDYGNVDPRPFGVGGGSMPCSFALKWRDAAGNVHRSFVANEQITSWVSFSGGRWYARRWIIPRPWPLALTQGTSPQQYQIEVYQSGGDGASAGGTRYLVAEATPKVHPTLAGCDYVVPVLPVGLLPATGAPHELPIVNNIPSTYLQCWQDTSPSEYVHIPPPPMIDLCSTQERVWGLSAEKGRLEVWPSKLLVEGFAPEFTPDLVTRIPAEGGECTAIAALDDKIVVFKERAIFVLFGDPGTNTGQRATLQTARLVSGDVGCSNPRSVVEGPFGIVFQASSDSNNARGGIHQIDRGLAVTFVGFPAKDTTAGVTFESATLVPAEKEVRWVMPSTNVLVWSYDLNRWHVQTLRARFSSCLRRGRFASLTNTTVVSADQNGWAHDAVTTFSSHQTQVVTSWLKLAGLQGFQRLWTATFLFKWYSGGITIEGQTDYNESWTGSFSRVFGSAALSSLAVSGSGSRVQVSVHLPVQKCEAIRFRITEDAVNSPGRGFELVGLTLEAGVKRGSYRRNMTAAARK
jgi:hypothetical protein